MAQGPINIPRGAESPSSSGGVRTCRVVVGTSTAGWTAADCDYLCDGVDDQVEIQAAIDEVQSTQSGGTVVILGGTYNVKADSSYNPGGRNTRACVYTGRVSSPSSISIVGEADDVVINMISSVEYYYTQATFSSLVGNASYKNIIFTLQDFDYTEDKVAVDVQVGTDSETNVSVNTCVFVGKFSYCVYSYKNLPSSRRYDENKTGEIIVTDCTFGSYSTPVIAATFANGLQTFIVTNCIAWCDSFAGNSSSSIKFNNYVRIENNKIYYREEALAISTVNTVSNINRHSSVSISNNVIVAIDSSAARYAMASYCVKLSSATGGIITNNFIDCYPEAYVEDPDEYNTGIFVDGVFDGLEVVDNVIRSAPNCGVYTKITSGYTDNCVIDRNLTYGGAVPQS